MSTNKKPPKTSKDPEADYVRKSKRPSWQTPIKGSAASAVTCPPADAGCILKGFDPDSVNPTNLERRQTGSGCDEFMTGLGRCIAEGFDAVTHICENLTLNAEECGLLAVATTELAVTALAAVASLGKNEQADAELQQELQREITILQRIAQAAKTYSGPGFAPGTGVSALSPERIQHATDELRKAGVLPAWSGRTGLAEAVARLAPILERPSFTFDVVLRGPVPAKGFLAPYGDRVIAVLVFKEGPLAGQIATSFVPSANQLTLWGVK